MLGEGFFQLIVGGVCTAAVDASSVMWAKISGRDAKYSSSNSKKASFSPEPRFAKTMSKLVLCYLTGGDRWKGYDSRVSDKLGAGSMMPSR